MNKNLCDMTLIELWAERERWRRALSIAQGWGAWIGAAMEFLNDAERELRRRGVKPKAGR